MEEFTTCYEPKNSKKFCALENDAIEQMSPLWESIIFKIEIHALIKSLTLFDSKSFDYLMKTCMTDDSNQRVFFLIGQKSAG